ncbi:hypothetical protein [Streptomyces sp. NPDC003247]|uniref:hypothetical protein n=1 Tax=Streptomyces sp. NPDC003247 TaxID=3364677 RepID=UPI0036B6DD60
MRGDQAALVGDDDELGAVAGVESMPGMKDVPSSEAAGAVAAPAPTAQSSTAHNNVTSRRRRKAVRPHR